MSFERACGVVFTWEREAPRARRNRESNGYPGREELSTEKSTEVAVWHPWGNGAGWDQCVESISFTHALTHELTCSQKLVHRNVTSRFTMARQSQRRSREEESISEDQIIAILKESEGGVEMGELCRRHGIAKACFLPLEEQVRRFRTERVSQVIRELVSRQVPSFTPCR